MIWESEVHEAVKKSKENYEALEKLEREVVDL